MRSIATRVTFAAALAATLLACNDATGPAGRLSDARARWLRARPTRYEFRLAVSCFCARPPQPLTITVQGDSIVSAVDATGAPLRAPWTDAATTIDRLFGVVALAIEHGADVVDVAYDRAYGYPRSIVLEYERNVPDGESRYTVDGFVAR